MSYFITLDGTGIYSAATAAFDGRYGLLAAELTEEENKIPKLEISLPPGHPAVSLPGISAGRMEVWDGDEMLFTGRVRQHKKDWFNRVSVSCEGALGYLADIPDTTTVASEESPVTVQAAFAALLAGYYAAADAGRKIKAGDCDVTGSVTKTASGQVWDTLNGWLGDFGGYLTLRLYEGELYLDYKAARAGTDTSQVIAFGVNLLETLDRMTDAAKIETGVLAIGGVPEGASAPVTLSGYAGTENGVLFAASRSVYGSIYKKVEFKDALTQAALYAAAQGYLNDVAAAAVSLKLSAVENKLLGLAPAHMKLGASYRTVSAPHGLDAAFPLLKRKLDLLEPDKCSTEFGAAETALTERQATWNRNAGTIAAKAETALQTASAAKATADAAVPATRTVNGHSLSANVTVTQSDLGAAEYVTATGSDSSGWRWRKWSSGTVEMWAEGLEVSLGSSSAWTTDLIYQNGTITYPLTMDTSVPVHVRTQVVKPDGVTEVNGLVLVAIKQSAGSQIRFVRKTAATKVYLDVYVRGKEAAAV